MRPVAPLMRRIVFEWPRTIYGVEDFVLRNFDSSSVPGKRLVHVFDGTQQPPKIR